MRVAPLILGLAVAAAAVAPAATAATIVIDTGHAPSSPGSKASDGTPEFQLNRAMAQRVINALRARGHTVVDVYEKGQVRNLMDRTTSTKGADLFLSIHHDSIQQFLMDEGRANEFSGFAVFVSAKSKQLQGSLKCAIHVGEAMVKAGERPSRYHAAPIKGENRPLVDDRRGIHKYDELVVLKTANSPAVLLEVGVAVNAYEIVKLQDPKWGARVAEEIADGVGRCVPPAPAARTAHR